MACKRFVGSIPIASTKRSWSEGISGQGFFMYPSDVASFSVAFRLVGYVPLRAGLEPGRRTPMPAQAKQIAEGAYVYGFPAFPEEIGQSGEQLGSFPPTFTHLSLINAAIQRDAALDNPTDNNRLTVRLLSPMSH
jgi:hypothetical protein